MKIETLLPLCIFWLLTIDQLSGQSAYVDEQNSRLFFITEIGYLSGTGNVTVDNFELSNEGFGAFFKFITGYRINNQFAGGLGFGLNGYHEPSSSTFPIFIAARWNLKDANNTPFTFVDFGYAVKLIDSFETGILTNFGVGYKLYLGFFGRRAHLLPSVGFNIQQIKRERQIMVTGQFPPQFDTIQDDILVKSFSINLGVEF